MNYDTNSLSNTTAICRLPIIDWLPSNMKESKSKRICRNNIVESLIGHDFEILILICQTPFIGEDANTFAKLIFKFLHGISEDTFFEFIQKIFKEIKEFRNYCETTANVLLSSYLRETQQNFLRQILGSIFDVYKFQEELIEVEPLNIDNNAISIIDSQHRVEEMCDVILTNLIDAYRDSNFPSGLKRICGILWRETNDPMVLTTISTPTSSKPSSFLCEFLDNNTLMESTEGDKDFLENCDDSKGQIIAEKVLGSLVFLRFLIPGIINYKGFLSEIGGADFIQTKPLQSYSSMPILSQKQEKFSIGNRKGILLKSLSGSNMDIHGFRKSNLDGPEVDKHAMDELFTFMADHSEKILTDCRTILANSYGKTYTSNISTKLENTFKELKSESWDAHVNWFTKIKEVVEEKRRSLEIAVVPNLRSNLHRNQVVAFCPLDVHGLNPFLDIILKYDDPTIVCILEKYVYTIGEVQNFLSQIYLALEEKRVDVIFYPYCGYKLSEIKTRTILVTDGIHYT
ncbi:hypothetical protein ROZALSC1DRAFT_20575 [Rozella allomycis CSF55]|uniref:Ras-GAP domain-containing protein n=1 Tax=Rozella allomycis (strain CSF55) TaxID=988480 RepID=A0A4P9YQM9_ROZAC|nr:hypothetical protein ROZALSC1DRAFT_20575 [Rozella allomycis CSF55]